jgi:hypothetical protein
MLGLTSCPEVPPWCEHDAHELRRNIIIDGINNE